MIKSRDIFFILVLLAPVYLHGQDLPEAEITFDFNDHTFNEKNNKLKARPVAVTLTEDRFGNKSSAIYIHGHNGSYFNLGSSALLKPKKATISLWVKLDRKVLTGRGYPANPIIVTKNSRRHGWYNSYCIAYDFAAGRFGACCSIDSTSPEAVAVATDLPEWGQWHHVVMAFDKDSSALFVNGKLQVRCAKGFETVYLEGDSVIVGHSASKVNERFSMGAFDDIQIFHRVLTDKEVEQLYNAPNPNKLRNTLYEALKYFLMLLALAGISFVIWYRYKQKLKLEKERFNMQSRISELEIKVMKAQMNPHFIFNSLNSLQDFIMTNQNEKAQIYLAKFSKLLRDILESNVNESLSIEEEVQILNHYLEMEASRFNRTFEYGIEVDKKIDVKGTRIPHLLVQPFVENAIWHGLLPKKDDRKLSIKFEYADDKSLRCIVEDNGIGRAASSKKEATFKKKSLALSFVKQRLELMSKTFEVNCHVDIIDKTNEKGEAEGTKVIIILPIIK